MKIHCNNVPRKLIYGYELTEKERADFDYLTIEELETRDFVRYKGQLYDIGEFLRIEHEGAPALKGFDGYTSDSFFSGVLFRHVDPDHCVLATYYS